MPDIVLINPSSPSTYQDLGDLTAVEPPLWCRMIAGWLSDNGYVVALVDQAAEGLSHEAVAQRVRAFYPALVAIVVEGHQPSASTQTMVGASELARELQDQRTIMLGNHPSALPARTLAEENVDFVCDGEGPLTLAALLDEVPLEDAPGLVWDSHGELRKNPRAPLLPIDELAGDVWASLPMDSYRAHNWQCLDGSDRTPYASIYTTLGCPFKCSFCMINVFQHTNRYRMRSPESVVEEIDMLYNKYGVKTLKIADEMFVLNDTHVREICEGLAEKPYVDELNIWAYARIDTIKPDQPELLRRAGIRWLALGIESGSAHVRDGADKSFDQDGIFETVRRVQNDGINVIANYIFGLPDDTHETMRETLDMAKELNTEFANFYSAMAYPGSKLYSGGGQPWSSYSQHSLDCAPMGTATLSPAEVLKFRDEAFREYFSGVFYQGMILSRFGEDAVREIESMVKRPLPRVGRPTSIVGLDHLQGENVKVWADGP